MGKPEKDAHIPPFHRENIPMNKYIPINTKF